MKFNIGNVDSISRIALGVGGLVAGYINNSTLWYGIGAIVILSGLIGFDPIYEVIGLKTGTENSSDEPDEKEISFRPQTPERHPES